MEKRSKIAIITSHHYPNYGNKLQNFALQTILCRMGFDVDTISDVRSWPDMWSWVSNWKVLIHLLSGYKKTTFHKKMLKFIKFTKAWITKSPYVIRNNRDANILCKKYDYFVVGSDQIWNPEWPIFSNSFGFAEFARKEQKIAYAPSLGVSEMIPERVEEYKHWLCNWKALSCRENEGAKILEELSLQKVATVLDPTLLLSKEEWDNYIGDRLIHRKYVLFYSIWKLDAHSYKTLEERTKKLGCKLVDISNKGAYDGHFNPFDFVNLVKYAEEVYTDSFHGACFSLLYHRPMIIIRATNTGMDKMSRLVTLFTHAGIENKLFSNILNEVKYVDWDGVDQNIAVQRAYSKKYLQTNLLDT